jgi:hypothetical protein
LANAATWHVFAYFHGDADGVLDEDRYGVPDWRLEDVLRWARYRGYDSILLTRDGETSFRRPPSSLETVWPARSGWKRPDSLATDIRTPSAPDHSNE